MKKGQKKHSYTRSEKIWLKKYPLPVYTDAAGMNRLCSEFNNKFGLNLSAWGVYSKAARLQGRWKGAKIGKKTSPQHSYTNAQEKFLKGSVLPGSEYDPNAQTWADQFNTRFGTNIGVHALYLKACRLQGKSVRSDRKGSQKAAKVEKLISVNKFKPRVEKKVNLTPAEPLETDSKLEETLDPSKQPLGPGDSQPEIFPIEALGLAECTPDNVSAFSVRADGKFVWDGPEQPNVVHEPRYVVVVDGKVVGTFEKKPECLPKHVLVVNGKVVHTSDKKISASIVATTTTETKI